MQYKQDKYYPDLWLIPLDKLDFKVKAPGLTFARYYNDWKNLDKPIHSYVTYSPFDDTEWGWSTYDRYHNIYSSIITAPDVIWKSWFIEEGKTLGEDRNPVTAPNISVAGLRLEVMEKWVHEAIGVVEYTPQKYVFVPRKGLEKFKSPPPAAPKSLSTFKVSVTAPKSLSKFKG